jgi:hypothetical protein
MCWPNEGQQTRRSNGRDTRTPGRSVRIGFWNNNTVGSCSSNQGAVVDSNVLTMSMFSFIRFTSPA